MQGDHASGILLGKLGAGAIAAVPALADGGADFGQVVGAIGDRRDQPRDRGIEDGNAPLGASPIARRAAQMLLALRVILAHQEADRLGRQQLLLQPRQHPLAELDAGDPAAVAAGSGFAVPRATPPPPIDHDVDAGAGAAADKPGQEMARPAAIDERQVGPLGARALHVLPKGVIHDLERGEARLDPVGLGVRPRDAVAALRIAHHADAVVDEPAVVDRVLEDAEEAAVAADERGRPPFAAAG